MTGACIEKKPLGLSIAPRGHWRNLWRSNCADPGFFADYHRQIPEPVGKFLWLDREQWPSREVAEQEAIKDTEIGNDGALVFLGPRFFSDT